MLQKSTLTTKLKVWKSEEELDEEDCGKSADELEEFSNKMRGNLLQHQRAEEARAANMGGLHSKLETPRELGEGNEKRLGIVVHLMLKESKGLWSQK